MPTPLTADLATYGWRVPQLTSPADVPGDLTDFGTDIARDLARSSPDPTILGAANGSGSGVNVTGNYVTWQMGELLVVPGSLVVPNNYTALMRVDMASDWNLSVGRAATAHVQYQKNGGSWTKTSWTGAWGPLAGNWYGSELQRIEGRPWTEYLNLGAGTYTFRMVGGSDSGAQVKASLVRINILLLTMYPPGVTASVPGGGEGTVVP